MDSLVDDIKRKESDRVKARSGQDRGEVAISETKKSKRPYHMFFDVY